MTMRNQKGENRIREIMAGESKKETGRNLQKNKKIAVNGNNREHVSRPISPTQFEIIRRTSVNMPAKLHKLQQINRDVILTTRDLDNALEKTRTEIKSLKAKHDLVVKDLKDTIDREKHEQRMETEEFYLQFKKTNQDWINQWKKASTWNRNLREENEILQQDVSGMNIKQDKLNLLLRNAKKMLMNTLDKAVQTTPVEPGPEPENKEKTKPKFKGTLKKGIIKKEGKNLLTNVKIVKPVEMQENENILGNEKVEKIPVLSEIQPKKQHEKPLETPRDNTADDTSEKKNEVNNAVLHRKKKEVKTLKRRVVMRQVSSLLKPVSAVKSKKAYFDIGMAYPLEKRSKYEVLVKVNDYI